MRIDVVDFVVEGSDDAEIVSSKCSGTKSVHFFQKESMSPDVMTQDLCNVFERDLKAARLTCVLNE